MKIEEAISPRNNRILIVGVESIIGSALKSYLESNKFDVYGTTRKSDNVDSKNFQLDLLNPSFEFSDLEFSSVVICASVTGLASCEQNEDESAKINVEGTLKTINFFCQRKCHVIFLSSSAVFDASKPFFTPYDTPKPTTVYGKQKFEVEKSVDLKNVAILRLTKVIHPDLPILSRWRQQLSRQEPIEAFVDLNLSPLAIEMVSEAILKLINTKSTGIYHLGGTHQLSYFEFANEIFPEYRSLIRPVSKKAEGFAPVSLLQTSSVFKQRGYLHERTYSSEGQDRILDSIFRNISVGFYMEIGANHPISNSNTFKLYLRGWSGLCVDGNSSFEPEWCELRPRDRFLNALVSDTIKDVDFVFFPDDTMNTIDHETAFRYQGKFSQDQLRTERRTTTTVEELRRLHLPYKEVHLLAIDVEGEDLNVLKGAALEVFLPGVILIETKNFSFSHCMNNEIVNFLYEYGYRLIAKTPLDAFFVHPSKDYLDWIPNSLVKG